MAEQAFDIRDVERILKSLFPQTGENPLGELRAQLIKIREEQLAFEQGYDSDQEELFEELGDIKTRTFGILILQIINILRTLMGLLPAGRIILLAIAAMGLVTTYLQTGTVSGADIQAAVQRSGLGEFIREQLRRLAAVADEQATRVEQVIDLGGEVVDAAAAKAAAVLVDLEFMFNEISAEEIEDVEQLLATLQTVMAETIDQASQLTNLTGNMDSLIFGALKRVPEQIRDLPASAAKLVE